LDVIECFLVLSPVLERILLVDALVDVLVLVRFAHELLEIFVYSIE